MQPDCFSLDKRKRNKKKNKKQNTKKKEKPICNRRNHVRNGLIRGHKGVVLTLKPLKLLMETVLHVLLQLAQRGRLQHLKVDLYLVGVGLARGGLQRLNDLHHAA